MKTWPKQDYASMVKFFGAPGTNQTRLDLPYPMRLTWNASATVRHITCHEIVAAHLDRIFTRTMETYSAKEIESIGLNRFSGCLNVRKMRGGSAWSIHSWGAAVDIDDVRNQLKWGRDKARLAKPDAERFWRIVEEEGAVSLGRQKNYDWMHFQFARL